MELPTCKKTIKNRKEAIEAARQIAQVLCNLYDVKHKPPEIVHESETRNTQFGYYRDTGASDIETSLCDEENHLAEADFVLNQKKVNVSDSMTALLKVSSDPEASGRSFQHETPHSKEETVEAMPKPDFCQAYRTVAGNYDKCSMSEALPNLPAPNWIWMHSLTYHIIATTEPSENGTQEETVEATEVTNQPVIGTIEQVRISDEHQDNTGKHLDETGKHLDDADKHLDETGKHLDETGKHLDDADKHLGETVKHLDDTDKHLDETGIHVNETGKHLDNTGKHLDETDRCLEYTDKHQDDTDKSYGLSSAVRNSCKPIRSEAEIELAGGHLDGDGDVHVFLESLLGITREKGYNEIEGTERLDNKDSDGEDHLDVGRVSVGQSLSDVECALDSEDPSDVECASDSEDPSDVECASDSEDPSDIECVTDKRCLFGSCGGVATIWYGYIYRQEKSFNVIQTCKEKFNSSGSKTKHEMEKRWTRFEGEPDINVKQSLKKRRGVLFGRVSRQGCLGNTDKPDDELGRGMGQQAYGEAKSSPLMAVSCFLPALHRTLFTSKKRSSKLLTLIVFMSLFCLSIAEVQEKRIQIRTIDGIRNMSSAENFGKIEKLKTGVGVHSYFKCTDSFKQPKCTVNLRQLKLTKSLKQPKDTEHLKQPKDTESLKQPKDTESLKQPHTWSFGALRYNELTEVLLLNDSDVEGDFRISEEEHCLEFQYHTGYTSAKDNFGLPTYFEQCDIGEVYAAILTELCLVIVVAVAYCFKSIKGEETYSCVTTAYLIPFSCFIVIFLMKQKFDEDHDTYSDDKVRTKSIFVRWIKNILNRYPFKSYQINGYYGELNQNYDREIKEELICLEQCESYLETSGTTFKISCSYCEGEKTYSWVTVACLISLFYVIVTFLMKQEFDDDHNTYSEDEVRTKSIFVRWIKNICVALVILFLSLLCGLCFGAVGVLHVNRYPFKSYQINGYYGELNQNYDREIKEELICLEQCESNVETSGTTFRNSCSYCEDKNEQQLEDCICLANKLLTLTYEDIENKRQLQQNLTLAEDLYNLNLEKQSNDGKPLTVDENEALVHEFSRIKPFSFPEGEDILNRSDTDQDFEVFEVEESQEKKHDSDSEDADNISIQNSEFTEHIDEQVEDCVKKVPRKASRRESNDGREVQSSSNGCGTDIRGAEGVQKEGAFCLFEVAEGDDKKLEVRVEIPLDALGGSIPLDNTYIGTGNRKPKATGQKKSKLRLQVFPNPHQGSRQYSDVDVAVEKKNSKSAFQNLNYKVKVESHSKKKIDSTFTEQDFDKYLEIRGYTWLPLNELPAPKLDPVSVAFLQTFEPVMVIIDQIANGTPPTPHVSMRYELLRFCTLRSYPKENKPHLIRLAMAGFYYASDSDGVVCYCCGVRRYNWVAKDDPMKVHQRINPNCKFLKKNEEVNVPVTYYGPYSEKLTYIMNIPEPVERPQVSEDVNNDWAPERIRSPAPAQQNSQNESGTNALGINTAIPKHPVYATKTTREASYNGWPDSSSHTPQELSDAGFFYAGFGDCVRCFYCGIGLRHWTKDDNPWIEHARWSRNCVYLRLKKGEEFVSLVQLALQYSQDNNSEANEASGTASASQDVEKILLSNAAQSVLEMGYQPKIIKRAIEELLRQNRNAKIVAQTLMEKLLEIEEAEDTVQTAEALAAAEETTPAQHTVKPKSSLSSEATKGTGASNTEGNSKKEGSGSIKAKSQTNDTSENSKVTSNELEKNDSKSLDPKTIKAENELLKEQTLCKVCLDNTVCIVFLPCGHLVTCADCAPAMRKCPICRALVKGTVRTYMS